MKAVILVGGLGTRLRPLTCNRPKPMLPIINEPFIEHMLRNLRDQGIDEAILAVQYLAERFREALGDGSRLGLRVRIEEEPEPRGTAGAVKHVAHMLDGTTFVFNGDVMTDLDLQAMLAMHRAKQSKLTIALTPVEDPTAFGLVETNAEGRIQRFLEKPRPEEITTNLINAGTYILEPEVLEYVPEAQFYMFEKGLFPDLLRRDTPMYSFPSDAYWTDIGKPQTYLDVHHDILQGKMHFKHSTTQIAEGVWSDGDATIAPSAQLIGPVVLGANARIGENARIIGPTVIGANCEIGAEATLEGAVLWDNNTIGAGAVVRNAVIGQGNTIGERTRVEDNTVIGDNCTIGADNILSHAMRLWPDLTLPDKGITF